MAIVPRPATVKGPAEWFTGEVYMDTLVKAQEPSRVDVLSVHFPPGTRTAWHSHPVGQTLVVTGGVGLHQSRGEPSETITAGDVVVVGPDVWHWHGATSEHFMSHLSVAELPGDGRYADFGEHVSDAEYAAADAMRLPTPPTRENS
jgi:quercetin dioxygenase-like cupin family protein